MNVLFIVPYPLGESPSQRFRFEQYFDVLRQNGIEFRIQSFLGSSWKVFYHPGQVFIKSWLLLSGFIRRTGMLFTLHRYDFVFIHREATPVGPPFFEWCIAKIFRKKIIYDFDDAIWLTDRMAEPVWMRWLKWRSKVGQVCSWSYKVSCGNKYLANYASMFNHSCIVNPTTVDTENIHNPKLYTRPPETGQVVVGWTGSSSTLKYLEDFADVLEKVVEKFPEVVFHVIADRKPGERLHFVKFVPWNSATEIKDLSEFHIGIMPLPNDEWSQGKCGFKAIQYMAMEIPAIVSDVGVNSEIVDTEVNGLVVGPAAEWLEGISRLIQDGALRKRMGKSARLKIIERYSVESNVSTFLSLFA
jgi:glycosyltransferase involved in cell wall biosynthesis